MKFLVLFVNENVNVEEFHWLVCQAVVFFAQRKSEGWARLDSNQGPRDYESPALPLSYRPFVT